MITGVVQHIKLVVRFHVYYLMGLDRLGGYHPNIQTMRSLLRLLVIII